MLTIPYLGFETFKNYTLLGDTYLSSTCILIKVTMLMFCRSWCGAEKSVIQILWFLVLLWEVKMCFLRNDVFHCVFIWLHGNIFYCLLLWDTSSDISPKYFCANVPEFQWTIAFSTVTSGFKRSFKQVSSSSMYLRLPPFHD